MKKETIKRICCGVIQRCASLFLRIGNDCVGMVFMFHQVADDVQEWRDDRYCITANAFRSFLEKAEKKYRVERIDDLLKTPTNSGLRCFITFDDAFACVYKEAIPILQQKQLPFAVFLTTDLIGVDGYMTREMVGALSKNPLCTIGSHGVSHRMFRGMPDAEALIEIRNSKSILSSIIQKKVDFFAFPYGSIYACSGKAVRLLEKEGYKRGFSTIKAPLNKRSVRYKYFLPRINVNQNNYSKLVE